MKLFLYTAFLLWGSITLLSQQKEIDSIKSIVNSQMGNEKIHSLNELSWYYRHIDADSAFMFSKWALIEANGIGDKKSLQSAYNSLANVYDATGQLDSAEYFHLQALDIQLELIDSTAMASSYNNLGIVYDLKGLNDQSLEMYFQSLRIYEALDNDPYSVAMVLGNIGIVYKKQKVYDKVLEYYEKALAIYSEQKSDFGVMVTLGNIGSVLINLGRFESSIDFSERALKAYEQAGYTRYVGYMYHSLAAANDSLGNRVVAEEQYISALDGHRAHHNSHELANTAIAYTDFLLRKGEPKRGLQVAREALENARIADAAELEVKATNLISKHLASLGRYKEAYDIGQSYFLGKDSLIEESKTKLIFELETKYETEKKEQTIALQEATITQQDLTIERNTYLLVGSILILMLMLVIGFLARNRMKLKQAQVIEQERANAKEAQISAAISSQEKERSRFARDLHDGIGQHISLLNINIEGLEDQLNGSVGESTFKQSKALLDEMYTDLKNVCFDLMPQALLNGGIEPATMDFARRIGESSEIEVLVDCFGFEKRNDGYFEISLYRILQEWVNNVLKYAEATKITIQVVADENEFSLVIEDNGQGFDPQKLYKGAGNGWKNIQSRASIFCATVTIDSVAGRKGTTFIVEGPLTKSTSAEELETNQS